MNIKIIVVLFAFPKIIFGFENQILIAESSPLIGHSQTPETNPQLITLINKHIRDLNTEKLDELLIDNPAIVISDNLIDLARIKQKKSGKNCCRNLASLLCSGVGAVISIYLSMQPESCRPFSGTRFPFYIFSWMTAGCTTAHSLYSGFQLKNDWDKDSSAKKAVEMLEKHRSTQQ